MESKICKDPEAHMKPLVEDGPNLENQVKVRQQLIEEQKVMIKALSEDLFKIAHNSFELLLLATIPASHSPEVADHMEVCKAIVEQLTEKKEYTEEELANQELKREYERSE